jgi:hypothetical protein
MISIFDCIKDVLHTKKGKLIDNVDDESTFNMYMLNRWCSMYSPNMAILINNTCNWLYNTFIDKQQYYKFMLSVLPRVPNKRIHYIKKNKQDKKTENSKETLANIDLIAKRLELSQREIKSYYELQNSRTTRTSQSE